MIHWKASQVGDGAGTLAAGDRIAAPRPFENGTPGPLGCVADFSQGGWTSLTSLAVTVPPCLVGGWGCVGP